MKYLKISFVVLVGTVLFDPVPTSLEARSLRNERRKDVIQDIRQDHRQDRRVTRRVTRRVMRRHHYVVPVGHRIIFIGGHRYYRWGGVYYYPYFFGGRTVYVEIDLVNGSPMAPPPASTIQIEIDL